MMPGTYDLRLYRGDTYAWQFVLWADDAKTQAIDLTGATVLSEIREKPGGIRITELPCTVTLPNTIRVDLAADNYVDMPWSSFWDLEVTFPGDVVQTVVAGKVTVTGDITNSAPAQRALTAAS